MFGSVPAPSVRRDGDVRQIRRDLTVRRRAADGVAAPQRARHEDVAATALLLGLRIAAPAGAWPSSQRCELAVGLGDDVERHVRVLKAAELSALPAEDSGLVGLQPDRGDVAGNQIAFALEVRRPEAVDDVAGRDFQHHGPLTGMCSSFAVTTRRPGTASS